MSVIHIYYTLSYNIYAFKFVQNMGYISIFGWSVYIHVSTSLIVFASHVYLYIPGSWR